MPQQPVEDGERVGRAAGDVEIHRHHGVGAAQFTWGCPTKGPPAMAHAPTAMTILGSGTASYVFRRASSMLLRSPAR